MKKVTLIMVAGLLMTASFGQISGTFTIPGATYGSIASAISALNTSGIGEGGVTFNVLAGHTETFALPTDGILTIPVNPPTASNRVVFQKAGEGLNPKITAATGTGSTDVIIAISGLSYITFDGIDLIENEGNTTIISQMEWGYALLKASGTQGSSNNTIQNCTITLKNTNPLTFGIYSNNHTTASTTQLAVTAASGQNSLNRFYGNTITNSYGGIYLYGYADPTAPYNFYDQNNDIGSVSGNTVTNFGGGSTDEYLVAVYYQNNVTIANCNISGTGTGTAQIYGIYGGTANNASADIYGNTVTIVQSVSTTGAINGIYIPYTGLGTNGTTNTLNIHDNTVQDCAAPNSTTSFFYGIYHFSPAMYVNFYNNVVNNNVFGGSNYMYMAVVYGGSTSGVVDVYNNVVSNNQRSGTGTQSATAYVYCLWVQGSARSIVHDNHIFGNSCPGQVSRTANLYGLYLMPGNTTVYNNTIHDQTITSSYSGSNTLYGGIYANLTYYATNEVYNNTVYNLNINLTSTGTGLIYGIYTNNTDMVHHNLVYNLNVNSTSTGYGYGYGYYYTYGSPHTGAFYRNKLYNVKMEGPSAYFSGVYLNSGTAINVYNNYVSDLKTPSSTSSDGLHGIYVKNPTSAGIYNNTIYLNGTSSSTSTFYSDCIYATTNPTLDMQNNILVNLSSAPGSTAYIAAAYRRNSATLTSYAATSDRNNFYVGTPSANNLIYTDGTNNIQTLAAYQALVAPRDANSFTENPPFNNVSTTPYDLHIRPNDLSLCESGGAVVSSPVNIVTDFDGDARYPNTGYPNNPNPAYPGTAPDVGADEFGGIRSYVALSGLTGTVQNAVCATSNDGAINVTEIGGTPPFAYLWSNSATTQDLTGLAPGTYSVTVVDNVSAQATGSWTVSANGTICNTIGVSGTVSAAACHNAFQTITVQDLTLVSPGGQMELISGGNILIMPGTVVQPGAWLWGHITTTATYCPGADAPDLVAAASQGTIQTGISPSGFMLYPNPTSGKFILVQKSDHVSSTVEVELFTMNGLKVGTGQLTGEKAHEFDASALPAGLYVVKVIAGNHVEMLKLVRTE